MTYIPPVNGGRINVTIGGNTTGTGALMSTGTATLVGGNNITLSQNGNALTIVGGAGGGGGVALANSQTTYNSGTANFVASGALTIVSATGQSFNFSVPQTSNLSATGAVSISSNAGTISIGAPAFSAGISNIGNALGTTGTASNRVIFAGGNNVTLSQSTNAAGNTITIQAGGGGMALANSQTTFTSGTANFIEGGGAITIASTTGQSFKVSVPQISSLSATGAVSISTNGGTISIGVPAATLSRFEYPEGLFTSLGAIGQGSLSINHMYVPFYVTGTAAKIGGSLSAATNTSATTASANISLWMGIYTLNGSTLSLASSGSANNGFQFSQSASSTGNTSINSMRQMTVPMNINISPGEYWMAAVISSATTYTSAGFTMYGNNQVANAASAAILSPIGATAARDVMLLQGIYTAATSAGPTSIAGTQINNTAASIVQRANFYNVIFNATY
ncbi:MAG TPA: hypothetical protein VLF64_00545 [Candidatus Saccharimonadales bacterium]|nr:hypothetical protein [Candidatus Saccharimonadales bacterium]